MKTVAIYFSTILIVLAIVAGQSWSQKGDPTILSFKVEALYRAAKLTWKTKGDLKNEMSLQVLRADTFEEGPYNEVGVVKINPGKSSYEYIDKSMGAEP